MHISIDVIRRVTTVNGEKVRLHSPWYGAIRVLTLDALKARKIIVSRQYGSEPRFFEVYEPHAVEYKDEKSLRGAQGSHIEVGATKLVDFPVRSPNGSA